LASSASGPTGIPDIPDAYILPAPLLKILDVVQKFLKRKIKDENPKFYKKFELMLTRRAKAYSSFYPQAVTHRSTNRARRKVTSFQPKRATNYATLPTPVRTVAPPCE